MPGASTRTSPLSCRVPSSIVVAVLSDPAIRTNSSSMQDSRWISNTAVQCIVPPGTGILLPVHVTICGCSSGAELKGQATTYLGPVEARMGASPVTFSYDEDVIQVWPKTCMPSWQQRRYSFPADFG